MSQGQSDWPAPRPCDHAAAAAGHLPGVTSARVGDQWNLDRGDLFVTIGHRFGRVEEHRRMRYYVPALDGGIARPDSVPARAGMRSASAVAVASKCAVRDGAGRAKAVRTDGAATCRREEWWTARVLLSLS